MATGLVGVMTSDLCLSISIQELHKSASRCAKSYRAFAREYGNASCLFITFRDELERVEHTIRLQRLFGFWICQDYPGLMQFREVLDEASLFARFQKHLVGLGVRVHGNASLAASLPLVVAAFETKLPSLYGRVVQNRIRMLVFSFTRLLRASLGLGSHTVLARLGHAARVSGFSGRGFVRVEQLIKRLSSIGAAYADGHPPSLSAFASDSPDREVLDSELGDFLASICAAVDLPAQRLAIIPVRDLPVTFAQDWWQDVVQGAKLSSKMSVTTKSNLQIKRKCRVEIDLGGARLDAYGYVVFERCIYWLFDNECFSVEHRLPISTQECFPRTVPGLGRQSFALTFLEVQNLTVKGPADRVVACRPLYSFSTGGECRTFQTDIRARPLMCESYVNSVRCKTLRDTVASKEYVKVWGPPTGSVDRSISFAARFGSRVENHEYPLKWFGSPFTSLHADTVRLDFINDADIMQQDHSFNDGGVRICFRNTRQGVSGLAAGALESPLDIGSRGITKSNLASLSRAPVELIERIVYIEFTLACAEDASNFMVAVSDPFVAATPSSWMNAPASRSSRLKRRRCE